MRPTGHALHGVVIARGTDDRANRDQPIHHLSQSRKEFADLDPRHVGLDRPQRAADLRRCLHLHVKHVLVGRPARQKDHDDGLVRVADPRLLLGLQKLRQR